MGDHQKRDQWLQDIQARQSNVVFPDAVQNEARFWRKLGKGPSRIAARAGLVVLAIFVLACVAIILVATSGGGVLWESLLGSGEAPFGEFQKQLLAAESVNTVVNPAVCGGVLHPFWCNGSDIGAWINAAYTQFGGVTYSIPAGTYSQTTAVNFNTAGQCPVVKGAGYLNTRLNWAGSTSGVPFTFDCYSFPATVGIISGFGLRDIALVGSGTTSTTIGLLTGGTNGAAGFYGEAISVSGFNINLEFGNNTWMWKCVTCNFDFPQTNNVLLPSSGVSNTGESLQFVASTFQNSVLGSSAFKKSCVHIQSAANLTFTGGSFEDCQYVQDTNASGGTTFVNIMFGNFDATSDTYPMGVVGAGNVNLIGGECGQAQTGSLPTSCWAATAGAIESHGYYVTNVNTSNLLTFAISGTASLIFDEPIQGGNVTQPPFTFTGGGSVMGRSVDGHNYVSSTGIRAAGSYPVLVQGGGGANDFAVMTNAGSAYNLLVTDAGVVSSAHNTLDDGSGNIIVSHQLESSVASGTAPIVVATGNATRVPYLTVGGNPVLTSCGTGATPLACSVTQQQTSYTTYGVVRMSSGAGSITGLPYRTAFSCTASDVSNVANSCIVVENTVSSATVTGSSGSGSDRCSFICVGK